MKRIAVIGTSCSGKSTLAKSLAEILGYQHIELDSLYWLPNWTPRSTEEFKANVSCAIQQDQWTLDGNYSIVRPMVWQRVDTIIWLNYPFYRVFWRALKRTITRAYTKEHVCNGNIESWKQSFFSKESILLWVITTHKKRQREYPILLMEYSHCTIIELRSQEQADELLARVRLTS